MFFIRFGEREYAKYDIGRFMSEPVLHCSPRGSPLCPSPLLVSLSGKYFFLSFHGLCPYPSHKPVLFTTASGVPLNVLLSYVFDVCILDLRGYTLLLTCGHKYFPPSY
jgi:hypothetical protein